MVQLGLAMSWVSLAILEFEVHRLRGVVMWHHIRMHDTKLDYNELLSNAILSVAA